MGLLDPDPYPYPKKGGSDHDPLYEIYPENPYPDMDRPD